MKHKRDLNNKKKNITKHKTLNIKHKELKQFNNKKNKIKQT